MARTNRLRIRLYGPFTLCWDDGEEIDLRSNKAKAILALLATAPEGKRTRAFIQDILWQLSGPDHRRASLRQALSSMKRLLGTDSFSSIFLVSNDTIRLRPDCFVLVGGPKDGVFLEGLDVTSKEFNEWIGEQRAATPDTARLPAAPIGVDESANAWRNGAVKAEILRERLLPVVAVIPFAGVDGQGLGSHFGDAVAQDITRSLSRSPFLAVISHLSSRNERLRTAQLSELKDLLNADYVIYGQVRLGEDRFRLDVDFVDAATGRLCWTEDFTGKVKHFFEGSDEVVHTVADAITRAVLSEAIGPLNTMRLPDIETHRLLSAGITLMHRQAPSSFKQARECLEEVVGRAPRHSLPRAWLAKWYVQHIKQGWSTNETADIAVAKETAARALDCNPSCPFSLAVNGFVRHHTASFDQAFAFHEEALAHDPNNSLAWLLTGVLHTFMGEGEQAVIHTKRARKLSPMDPYQYFYDSMAAGAAAMNGDYDDALKLADLSLQANRRYPSTLRVKTYTLAMLGREQEAKSCAAELMRSDPGFSITKYRTSHPSATYDTGRRWGEVLHGAGVPLNA